MIAFIWMQVKFYNKQRWVTFLNCDYANRKQIAFARLLCTSEKHLSNIPAQLLVDLLRRCFLTVSLRFINVFVITVCRNVKFIYSTSALTINKQIKSTLLEVRIIIIIPLLSRNNKNNSKNSNKTWHCIDIWYTSTIYIHI